MYYAATKKLIGLAFTLVITSKVLGQLNNCINTKEHPLIVEIIDSVKTNRNYNSILAYTVIKGDQLGLARSTVLNLAYAWATCKKITDSNQRKDEEFKYLDAILNERDFKALITYLKNDKYGMQEGEKASVELKYLGNCFRIFEVFLNSIRINLKNCNYEVSNWFIIVRTHYGFICEKKRG